MKITKFFFFFIICFSVNIFSQSKTDSVKTYKLSEITVKSGLLLEPKTVTQIGKTEIEKSDAATISELGKFVPSVKLQTNSRGESLFYLRGSGERQLSLFFDGVPLNIPWDNRIDLSLVPTDAIEGISVTKGIPSIVYGANALAGVINISSKEHSTKDGNRKFTTQFGENSFKRFSGNWLGMSGKFTYLLSGSYKTTDGYNLPQNKTRPLSNPGRLRINSDSKNISTFAKLKYQPGDFSDINFSVSYINAEKGVPAETDVNKPRYWRYPLWQKLSLNLNGSNRFGEKKANIFAYSFSVTNFKMDINQYKDISYTALDDIEKDKDLVLYGRLIYTRLFGISSILKLSASGFNTLHKESFLQNNYAELSYSQNVFSFGSEYEFIKSKYSFTAGVSLDGASYPKTGDKPFKDVNLDYSVNTSFIYSFNSAWMFQFNAGRKTRFPTLRESFSGALGRFVPNPELKSESAVTIETSLDYVYSKVSANVNFFFTKLNDGIVRQSLPGKQFKRINKDAIRTMGIELTSSLQLSHKLKTTVNFTYLNSFAKSTAGTYADTLEYKPAFVAGFNVDYEIIKQLFALVEFNFVGKEFGLQEGNTFFKKLPEYGLFNARFSYTFNLYKNSKLETYFRVNNIFDSLYYTQWSLPNAGRQFFGGVSLRF